MIISRALYRESLRNALMIMAVLVVVFLFLGLTGLLARAARGEIADRAVLAILGLQTARRFDLLLPLAFYLGALFTITRWYRDSEMAVLAACGVGTGSVLKPLTRLAVVVALVVAGFSFLLTPYASHQIDVVKTETGRSADPLDFVPGTFAEASGRNRIVYASEVDQRHRRLKEMFAADTTAGRQAVIVANDGESYIEPHTGERFIVLRQGRVYDGAPGEAGFQIIEFDAYHLLFRARTTAAPGPSIADAPTAELWRKRSDPAVAAVLHGRLARPLSVVVLVIYAFVLAHTDARRGRFRNLFVAIVVYFIYSNLIGFGQALIVQGKLSAHAGLWWVHAAFVGVGLWLYGRRARNLPLMPRLGRA